MSVNRKEASMTLNDIIEVCQAYQSLGGAVAEQIDAVIENPTDETVCEQNHNALALADEKFLSSVVQMARWNGLASLEAEVDHVRAAINGELV